MIKKLKIMTRIFTIVFCFLFVTNFSFAQAKQTSLIIKKTADWCPFCGTYGWDFFKKLQDQGAEANSIMIAMHFSGVLSNETAIDLNKNFSGPGQPVFFDNGTDILVGSSNVDAKVKDFLNSSSSRAAVDPKVSFKFKLVQKGTRLSAQIELENQAKLDSAEYSVSLFVLRDKFIANQASVGSMASHINILSAKLTPTTYGIQAYKGNIAAKTKLNLVHDFDQPALHNGKAEDVKIAAILWSKNKAGRYDFINGNVLPLNALSTSVENLTKNISFSAFQRDQNLVIRSENHYVDASIKIFDTKGSQVQSFVFEKGEIEKAFDVSGLKTGIHLVQISAGAYKNVQKIFISK
jgi:Secretion system C-terminal sorting domain